MQERSHSIALDMGLSSVRDHAEKLGTLYNDLVSGQSGEHGQG
jgi:hypothetical protein